jgi:hypothetical protein
MWSSKSQASSDLHVVTTQNALLTVCAACNQHWSPNVDSMLAKTFTECPQGHGLKSSQDTYLCLVPCSLDFQLGSLWPASAGFLLVLFFDPEDEGSMFLFLTHMNLQHRKPYSPSYKGRTNFSFHSLFISHSPTQPAASLKLISASQLRFNVGENFKS